MLLTFVLINWCKGRSHIGKLSIWILVMALLNGVFAINKISCVFPVFSNDQFLSMGAFFYCLESICFFGSQWFFCIKYYETACELRNMFHQAIINDQKKTKSRQRKCIAFRWIIFTIYLLSLCLLVVAFVDEKLPYSAFVIFTVIGFTTQVLICASMVTLTACALIMYIRLVKEQVDLELNNKFVVAQVIFLIVWGIYEIIFGINYF